jgi:cytochrome c553
MLKSADPNIVVTIADGSTKTPNNANTELANYCLNCHRRDVYTNGNEAAQGNSNLSRFGHPTNTSCMSNVQTGNGPTGPKTAVAGCMNCHGGRKDQASYTSTTGQSGAMHGTSMTFPSGMSTSDPMGERFCNGAAWYGHQLGAASGSIGCQTIGSPDAYSGCDHHGGKWATTGSNYYYGYGQ